MPLSRERIIGKKKKAPHANCVSRLSTGRGGGTRTPGTRFWRPLLYQLSYTPIYYLDIISYFV